MATFFHRLTRINEKKLRAYCSKCEKKVKIYRNGSNKNGTIYICVNYERPLNVSNIWRTREDHWRRRGIADFDRDDYARLHKKQGGLCAICREPETYVYKGTLNILTVDHDHNTGKVRALLCRRCNLRLGFMKESIQAFEDDLDLIHRYIKYLRKYKKSGE